MFAGNLPTFSRVRFLMWCELVSTTLKTWQATVEFRTNLGVASYFFHTITYFRIFLLTLANYIDFFTSAYCFNFIFAVEIYTISTCRLAVVLRAVSNTV